MRDAIREAEQILFYIRSAQGLLDCFLDYGKFGVVKRDTQEEAEHDALVMRNSTELVFTIGERMRDALKAAGSLKSHLEGAGR